MLPVSSTESAAVASSMRITGTSTVKIEIQKLGNLADESEPLAGITSLRDSWIAIGFSAGSAIRCAIHAPYTGPARAAVGRPTSRP